jgi:hypothetical protein
MTAKKRYKTLSKGQDPISVLIGSEPQITGEDIEGQISNALNWYRNAPAKLYPKFIREYMDSQSYSKEEIARAIRGPKKAYEFFAVAVYGRMVVRGVVLPESAERKLKESVDYLLSKNPVKTEVEVPKVSVQDHIKEKANRLIFALEAEIDEFATALKNGKKHSYDLVEWFKKNEVKAVQAEYIHKHFEPRLEQITSAIDGSDKDMKEAYSWLTKPSLRKYADFYGEIITLAKEQVSVAKTNRKPRKKKEKTPAQLVSKMPYAAEFAELSIKSVNPEEIVGASRVVVYNTKKQTIAVYNSSELSNGLSVKGNKIINFDIKTSTMKKVRDPKKSVQKFLGGLRAINNAFSEIKTKEKPVNGKVNQDCLIVQAITK